MRNTHLPPPSLPPSLPPPRSLSLSLSPPRPTPLLTPCLSYFYGAAIQATLTPALSVQVDGGQLQMMGFAGNNSTIEVTNGSIVTITLYNTWNLSETTQGVVELTMLTATMSNSSESTTPTSVASLTNISLRDIFTVQSTPTGSILTSGITGSATLNSFRVPFYVPAPGIFNQQLTFVLQILPTLMIDNITLQVQSSVVTAESFVLQEIFHLLLSEPHPEIVYTAAPIDNKGNFLFSLSWSMQPSTLIAYDTIIDVVMPGGFQMQNTTLALNRSLPSMYVSFTPYGLVINLGNASSQTIFEAQWVARATAALGIDFHAASLVTASCNLDMTSHNPRSITFITSVVSQSYPGPSKAVDLPSLRWQLSLASIAIDADNASTIACANSASCYIAIWSAPSTWIPLDPRVAILASNTTTGNRIHAVARNGVCLASGDGMATWSQTVATDCEFLDTWIATSMSV